MNDSCGKCDCERCVTKGAEPEGFIWPREHLPLAVFVTCLILLQNGEVVNYPSQRKYFYLQEFFVRQEGHSLALALRVAFFARKENRKTRKHDQGA